MKAADVMTRHVISIAPDASILDCVRLMLEYRISGLGVRRVDQGKEVEHLCCHPDQAYPTGDRMLAQKLWLEADEQAFCQIANRTPLIKEVREFVERLCEDAA